MDAQGWSKVRLFDERVILASKFFVNFTNFLTFRCESHSAFCGRSFAVITGVVVRHGYTPQQAGSTCVSQSPTRSRKLDDVCSIPPSDE